MCSFARCLVLVLIGTLPAPAGAQEPPPIADRSIYRSMVLPEVAMPARLYTPAAIAQLKERQNPLKLMAGLGRPHLGTRVAEIPPELWEKLIPPYAAFTMSGVLDNTPLPKCPFCGADYRRPEMTREEFYEHPFQARTSCCGAIVYEHEEDMPEDYPVRPNHTEMVPHLDGTEYAYRFYVPPGTEVSDYGLDAPRRNWFCPASEVWWARARVIHPEATDSPFKHLAAGVALKDDDACCRTLAIIYDRLARVYPGWPLVDWLKVGNGIARNAAMTGYLTAAEYRATEVPLTYTKPPWFFGRYHNLSKLGTTSSWQDGVMGQQASLLDVFDLIRDRPATRAYSLERYGDEDEWERRVRRGFVDEAHFICQWSPTGLRGGNTLIGWMIGALKVGTVTRDPFFVRTAAILVERAVQNQFFGDGMSVEGAFNYGGMMQGAVDLIPVLRDSFGVDYSATFPYTARITELGSYPVWTLWKVESMHNDQHAWFFTGCLTGWKQRPYPEPAYANEAAQCFPEYGLAAMRAGAPGSRMELIFNFLTALGHGHQAQLNFQLFYEGVQTTPDIGYACVSADITKQPWPEIKYPFEKLPWPPGVDFWWAWYGQYGVITEVHNVALVDGLHTRYPRYGPVTFRRFLGVDTLDRPGGLAQFAQASAEGMFDLRPPESRVDIFDRQVVAVTLPSGRPLMLDFHRLRGGKRHDLIFHAPSAGPDAVLDTSMGASAPVAVPSLYEYFQQEIPDYAIEWPEGQGIRNLQRLTRRDLPDTPWEVSFNIRPGLFEPATAGGKEIYEPWRKVLRDVDLDYWGSVAGSSVTRAEIIEARGPWPSKIREVVDGEEYTGKVIAMKDAFHFVFESRVAADNGLYSVYTHVYEPRFPDQPTIVKGMRQLTPGKDDDPTGSGLRLDLAEGTLFAGTTLSGGTFGSGDFALVGRFGVVLPGAASLTVYDGSHVHAGGFAGDVEASWDLELLGVVGDLTGTPDQSALLVAGERSLPTDGTLVGRVLTVEHRISARHTSGYTIAGVGKWGDRGYRIDLAHNPPFIMHRMSVKSVYPDDPRQLAADYIFMKGQNEDGLYKGRRVRFPRFGFDSPMDIVGGGWHIDKFRVLEPFPEGVQVAVDEPFIVYQIQPGDRVVIPSHLAVRGSRDGDRLTLAIEATGPCKVKVPGYRLVELASADLPDGRAKVALTAE